MAEVGTDRVVEAESISDKVERIAAEGEARDAIVAELADRVRRAAPTPRSRSRPPSGR